MTQANECDQGHASDLVSRPKPERLSSLLAHPASYEGYGERELQYHYDQPHIVDREQVRVLLRAQYMRRTCEQHAQRETT